ncbi:MAG: hypothetical protein WC822_04915 [Candidatus Paceibacterota bacterium]|jgi:hypothetical protein
MSLDEMIKRAQEKGLLSICPIAFRGKAEAAFGMLSIMAKTESIETDPEWWHDRVWGWQN